jgi:phytoene dehydrogenase-like protein
MTEAPRIAIVGSGLAGLAAAAALAKLGFAAGVFEAAPSLGEVCCEWQSLKSRLCPSLETVKHMAFPYRLGGQSRRYDDAALALLQVSMAGVHAFSCH